MSYERINELMNEAISLDNNSTKVAIIEEAMRLADELQDIETAYAVRMELIDAATFSDHDDKALVAFTWCLAQWDQDPELGDGSDLLWRFKWVLGQINEFPQVAKSQIVAMMDDYARRLDEAGYSLRPAHYLRWFSFLEMGDHEAAEQYLPEWQAAARDDMADCRACECNKHARGLIILGEDELALRVAQPILKGRLSCSEIPQATYAEILLPLMRLGRLDEADRYHQLGYRPIADDANFVETVAFHLFYLLFRRRLDDATRIFERHLPWVNDTPCPWSETIHYVVGELLFELLQDAGTKSVAMRIPDSWDCYNKQDRYDTATLAEWFKQRAESFTERFDKRNGNTFISNSLHARRELVRAGV